MKGGIFALKRLPGFSPAGFPATALPTAVLTASGSKGSKLKTAFSQPVQPAPLSVNGVFSPTLQKIYHHNPDLSNEAISKIIQKEIKKSALMRFKR